MPDGAKAPIALVNPEITWRSEETQTFEEGSLCFPHIAAEVTRPRAIRVRHLDRDGAPQELAAEGFLATVVQHEMDYLDGITFLDHLSRMKRDMLLKRMQKMMRLRPPAG
jgi:peptide deformylase